MSIMPCYPDERSVENELGGKWEKFYEYKFDDSHAEGFEFPTDLDGSPLTLNGVMFVLTGAISSAFTIEMLINNILVGNQSFTTTPSSNVKGYMYSRIENGLLITNTRNRAVDSGVVSVSENISFINEMIKNFTFRLQTSDMNYTEGNKVEIYVLRGV